MLKHVKQKKVRVFLKGQAKKKYLELKNRKDKNSKTIIKSVERSIELLKLNPQHGQPISKKLIPDELKSIGIQNLYRIELSNYWRLLYTMEGSKIEIYIFVLKIQNHNDYNKLLKYK